MRLASKMRQKGDDVKGADISDKQLDDAIKSGRLETRKSVKESVDVFDIIKGYLIDEGYADSEESALAIMTNMSEDWKESILLELTPLGTRAAGAVDDQRRGSTMAKDMMHIQKNLRKLNRPKGPTVMPTLPGV